MMRLALIASLVLAPAAGAQAALTADAVRAARGESNAAIARRDTLALAAEVAPAYHSVSSRNAHTSGRDGALRQWVQQFAAHPDVGYVRTPATVRLFPAWEMADERGHWTGHWTEPDGRVEIAGSYTAKWRRTDGRWLLEAEIFTPLSCRGSHYCAAPPESSPPAPTPSQRVSVASAPGVPAAGAPAPAPAAQNPSPMRESSRPHRRVESRVEAGLHLTLEGVLARPVELFVPEGTRAGAPARLIVHFMGSAGPPMRAVSELGPGYALAVVYLGAGGGIYERAFADTLLFPRLLDAIRDRLAGTAGAPTTFSAVYLSAFSAGYGAVRAIVSNDALSARLAGVLLLDGMHVSYVPERKVLFDGGALDTVGMAPFVRLARRAVNGDVRFIVTHSEIFPGTFASTTETADYLLQAVGVARLPMLQVGPVGMQQTSEATRGRFTLRGFAGNSAPDHLDHLHGIPGFLPLLFQ